MVALGLLVFLPALAIRIHPTVRESFQYDAITSQMAAERGVIANALDDDGAFELRRYHPPLLSYVILANNAVFGGGELGACAFSIVSGALTCVVVALGVAWGLALGGVTARTAWLAALFAGWLLAFLPVHLFVSRSSNWDALYALFSTSALLAIGSYAESRRPRTLYAAGVLAALALATAELGLFLAPAFAWALWLDARSMPPLAGSCVPASSAADRHENAGAGTSPAAAGDRGGLMLRWALLATTVFVALVILWPAGLAKLNLLRSVLRRAQDSVFAARNHPWHMFYVELFRQSPGFTIVAALGFFGFAAIALTASRSLLVRRLTPLWIYTAIAVALSFRQSWVHVHLKNDMFPPLAILGACLIGSIASAGGGRSRRPRFPRVAAAAVGAAALLSTIVSASTSDTMVAGPEEHPGYRGVAGFLARHPGARTYYYYATVMPYFLASEGIRGAPPRIEGDAQRAWSPEQITSVKTRAYDFIVTDFTFFDARFPDIERLGRAFAPEYALAHTVAHRRTGEPVAWIFARRGRLIASPGG